MTIPIGLQLYSVRGECARDLPGALRSTAQIGYAGAEPWGYNGETLDWQGHPVRDIRKMFDDNGLNCCGMHLTTGSLSDDNLQRTVEFNRILGNRFLIVAADQKRTGSLDGVMELAAILNGAADRLAGEGMFTGYHAHATDFKTKFDGKTAWEIFFDNTRPEVVHQIDIGNTLDGGGDPLALIRKYPGRTKTTHIKEHGGPPGAAIGEGTNDWKAFFEAYETVGGTEWYIVEHETGKQPLQSVKTCLDNLHKMGR